MKRMYSLFTMLAALLLVSGGCNSKGNGGPKELIDRYFTSAIKQDYATTYACYYGPYMAKVSKEDFMKHRKEASILQSYQILSLRQASDNAAHAEVQLTFTPSEKLKREKPASITVKEDLVKEGGEWKIRVW